MQTIFPPLMCRKVGLSAEGPGGHADTTAALVRSRRHKSPEKNPENVIAIAYEFNQDERTAIAEGALLYVGQVTYGQPPFQQLLHIGTDAAAEYYGVEQATEESLKQQRLDAGAALAKAWQRYETAVNNAAELEEKFHTDDDVVRMTRLQSEAIAGLQAALAVLGDANHAAGFGA